MNREQVLKLAKEGTYDGILLKGKLIETHISWVILAQKYAFKIKKPMQYSFLDFSTKAKRRYFCDRELELNRRLSDIYLDVVPIRSKNGTYCFGEDTGAIIEHAVRMKKMQSTKKMDLVLKKGRVLPKHMAVLAKKIADFHLKATVVKSPFDPEEYKALFNDILSVADWAKTVLGQRYFKIIQTTVAYSDDFLSNNENLMAGRIKNGFHRDVHGDLHSKNIFLYKDPVIFDCIEFNDSYRQIDVINEVAFFSMDLEANGKWELSKVFMNHYLNDFPCMTGRSEERLFAYYKLYRANVRAKVSALRGLQADTQHEIDKHANEMKKYLKLIERYLVSGS